MNEPILGPDDEILYEKFEHEHTARAIDFYLSGPISSPEYYIDLFHTIRTATPGEVITLHINSPGGALCTGIQMLSAMAVSEAHIVTSLEGSAYSMAGLLWLKGDEIVAAEHSSFLAHDYSEGIAGKGNEIEKQSLASQTQFASIANDIYYPFMTRKEIKGVLAGTDLWLNYPDIQKRLGKTR